MLLLGIDHGMVSQSTFGFGKRVIKTPNRVGLSAESGSYQPGYGQCDYLISIVYSLA